MWVCTHFLVHTIPIFICQHKAKISLEWHFVVSLVSLFLPPSFQLGSWWNLDNITSLCALEKNLLDTSPFQRMGSILENYLCVTLYFFLKQFNLFSRHHSYKPEPARTTSYIYLVRQNYTELLPMVVFLLQKYHLAIFSCAAIHKVHETREFSWVEGVYTSKIAQLQN